LTTESLLTLCRLNLLYGLRYGLNHLLGLIDRDSRCHLGGSRLNGLNGRNGLSRSRGRIVTLRDRKVRNVRNLVSQLGHDGTNRRDVRIIRPFLAHFRNDVQGDSLTDQGFRIESDLRRSAQPGSKSPYELALLMPGDRSIGQAEKESGDVKSLDDRGVFV